ncbi:hypothetical protein ACLD02_08810 [Alloalcanivorax sp. C16-2]|uniref:hypothetical protein n=1 Tax=Alloalcanivorax sp. C16-2 TaxID=3390052 RepID=UPI0039706849
MRVRRDTFSVKRRIRSTEELEEIDLKSLKESVAYCGNPAHKKNPGDFGLTPPSGARAGKSLCDAVNIFEKAVAEELLREGVRRGMVSKQFRGEWPQNIWAVTGDGVALEAQLENKVAGEYHGYPMPPTDPFAEQVLREWEARTP